jgi:hypothetical protein
MNLSLKSFLPPLDLGWNHVRARCDVPTCHSKLLTRAVPHSRTGIRMGQRWYCSPDCFVAGVVAPLGTLSRGRMMEMPRNPRLSLGLAMLSRGHLTQDQLRFAMEHALRGEPLETTLIRLGLANDKKLAAARAAQWGYPVLGHDSAGLLVKVDLPETVLTAFAAVPLHYAPAAKRLLLGFVHHVDHSLLQSIEQITGCRAEPCFMTPAEFDAQKERVIAVPDYEEVVVEEPGTRAQMARTLGGFAAEIAAQEANLVRSKSWIWSRLAGKRRTVDVLFALKDTAEPARDLETSDSPESVSTPA